MSFELEAQFYRKSQNSWCFSLRSLFITLYGFDLNKFLIPFVDELPRIGWNLVEIYEWVLASVPWSMASECSLALYSRESDENSDVKRCGGAPVSPADVSPWGKPALKPRVRVEWHPGVIVGLFSPTAKLWIQSKWRENWVISGLEMISGRYGSLIW